MDTFLKVFFGLILLVAGVFVIVGSPFLGFLGGIAWLSFLGGLGSFIAAVVIGIAMIAAAITLFVKAGRRRAS